jgi:hypothetical protein
MFVLTLADGLCCAWFVYPSLCWCWCPEIGTRPPPKVKVTLRLTVPIWGSWPDIYYCLTAVFLGSESLGTRDHILLSQIWVFPFRRLLRLAGWQWMYSTQPPNGFWVHLSESESESLYDWQSVSPSVLVSSPVLGSWPGICFDWQLLSCLYGAPSLTRGRVCHLSVIVDSNSLCQ